MSDQRKRLSFLSKLERDEFYGLPIFVEEERGAYFSLDDDEKQEMESLRSLESSVHFILQLGYFKAKFMVFDCSFSECQDDVLYIMNQFFPGYNPPEKDVSEKIRRGNAARILKLFSYKLVNREILGTLKKKALEFVKICVDPGFIFDSLVDFLHKERIVVPSYRIFQDIISTTLTFETERLGLIVEQNLIPEKDQTLKALLQSDSEKIYGITVLKKDAKGFNYKEVMKEVHKKQKSEDLFWVAKDLLPKLAISEQNICYYASLIDYHSVDRLNMLAYRSVRLYLLCYIYYRFEKIHDNLIHKFLSAIATYKKQADEYVKKAVYEHKQEINQYIAEIANILDLFMSDSIKDEIIFGRVRSMAFKLVDKVKLPLLIKYLRHQLFDETKLEWEYYLKIAKTIAKNLRPLVCAIDFEAEDSGSDLMIALTFIKDTFKARKSLKDQPESSFPLGFIPSTLTDYLYDVCEIEGQTKKILNVYKYEFLVYHQLEKSLDFERVFVNSSFSFKSLKQDLYPDWENNKEAVLAILNNPILNTPIQERLTTLEKDYNELLSQANQRIQNGENTSLRIKKEEIIQKDGKDIKVVDWTLPYEKNEEEIDNPFYDKLPQVSLNQVLKFVQEKTGFLDEFTHLKPRYVKTKADEVSLSATITALATGYSLPYMAGICDIGYTQLLSTFKNFIRLESLKKSNAKLVDAMALLPMFNRWNLLDNKFVSSVDGKKILTRLRHWMARHSRKYLGQKRGVVSYSMIVNNACLNGLLISPNDHESYNTFRVVIEATTTVKPDYLTGDTHSINRANFALLDLLVCAFIPHIKNIKDQTEKLSSFKDPSFYENDFLKPIKKFDTPLIAEQWAPLQHIFASLLMRRTSHHVIVKKLSSMKKSHKICKALEEYNKILHDTHVLKYIDDPLLRKAIRTSLNRGEGYHQLEGKIMSVNDNKLRGSKELELVISNECIRLVANCIIYYNTYLLSELYKIHEELGHTEVLELIKRLSPIAWRHINLNGRYEFLTLVEIFDLNSILTNLIFDNEKDYKKT